MEGLQQSSNTTAPFLTKTYEMVNDPMTNPLVSWSDSGCSFVVWDAIDFSRQLLPSYFKHNNFSSFVRQLNTYGFRKVDPDRWEFANEEFLRGESYRLLRISRRKPIHSHSAQFQAALTEKGRHEYEEKINRLRHENSLLQLELQKQHEDKQEFEIQIKSLRESFRNLECKQIQLIGFVAKVIKKAGFASTPISQSDTRDKKRRLLTSCLFSYEGSQNEIDVPKLELKQLDRLESSLEIWENLLDGIGYSAGNAMPNFNVSQGNLKSIAKEPDNETGEPCTPRSFPSSPPLHGVSSSPNLVYSMDHVDSHASFIYVDNDIGLSSCVIDINSKPGEAIRTHDEITKESAMAASSGVNDQFWEQFLTETPAALSDSAAIRAGRRAWMTA